MLQKQAKLTFLLFWVLSTFLKLIEHFKVLKNKICSGKRRGLVKQVSRIQICGPSCVPWKIAWDLSVGNAAQTFTKPSPLIKTIKSKNSTVATWPRIAIDVKRAPFKLLQTRRAITGTVLCGDIASKNILGVSREKFVQLTTRRVERNLQEIFTLRKCKHTYIGGYDCWPPRLSCSVRSIVIL